MVTGFCECGCGQELRRPEKPKRGPKPRFASVACQARAWRVRDRLDRRCESCGSEIPKTLDQRRSFCLVCLPLPSEIGVAAYLKRRRELRPAEYEALLRAAREATVAAKVGKVCDCGCGRSLERHSAKARFFDRACERAAQYGISSLAWDRMFEQQGRRCAACSATEPGPGGSKWATDHCHESGIVRGVLCQGCNTALGLLNESPERILGLLSYCAAHVQAR